MTNADLKFIRAAHDQADRLEADGRTEELARFFRDNHAAFDYDYDGNYVGQVANENGWTA